MPINRSPLKATKNKSSDKDPSLTSSVSNLDERFLTRHSGSAPDLPTLSTSVKERKKRKLQDDDEDVMVLIKGMFSDLSSEQDVRFRSLQTTIDKLREENLEMVKNIEFMSTKYDDFLMRISALETEKSLDKRLIRQMEEKLEGMERKNRATGIEIRNVPRTQAETKEGLCVIVQNMAQAMDLNLKESEIKDVYRINTKDSSNPIITEFTTVLKKEKIIKAVKAFNKNKKPGEKLNTSHLKLETPMKPVYVSETLTHKTQRLFHLARNFQKNYNYMFCWTTHGVVYLRKDEKSPQLRISTEEDIEKLNKQE